MTSEREQSHAQASQEAAITHDDAGVGRVNRSAQLEAPSSPVVSGLLARKVERDGNGVADGAEHAVAAAAGSSGSALPDTLMRKFESSLGADLSSVRVHTGGSSETAAHSVGAKAYTMGQDIHFGAGHYDPSSAGGQHLIAHEVAHTVQQRGGTPHRQNKLEVSTPHDSAEHEADHAADAMVSGRPAAVTSSGFVAARKEAPSTGDLQGAGDEAQDAAWKTSLSVDTMSVNTDKSRVAELIADITKQEGTIRAAEKNDNDLETKYAPMATNSATKANLEIFNDKVDVTNVDTTAFASQYRFAYADYARIVAEAKEYTSLTGAKGASPIATVSAEHEKSSQDLASTTQSERFRAARRALSNVSMNLDPQLTATRGAATTLQSSIYRAKAAAASASGADAAKKLAAIKQEIAEVAGSVATVVKVASAVGGLAGGGGATNAIGTARAASESGGAATIEASNIQKQFLMQGQTVLTPEDQSKKALVMAMGTDAAAISGLTPDAIVQSLVTAIGQYANKDKISRLAADIAKASAEEASFKAAAEASAMVGAQQTLEAEAKKLIVVTKQFASAKLEERAAGEALMAVLNKGGAKGKSQARSVMFLTDADRFLAQVEAAISAGNNQQSNVKQAAADRQSLRGTEKVMGDAKDAASQFYYRCTKLDDKNYKLDKVFVTFTDNGQTQGGRGTIEGVGGAADDVANKVKALVMARDEVKELQKQVQASLGLGEGQ